MSQTKLSESTLDRRELLAPLFPDQAGWLFVTGLAGPAKDGAALTDDGANMFTMAGTMGAAVTTGLGMALAAPDRKVAVICGDGELMMNVGSLATVASHAPANLTIVCIDNGCHGETGGQPGHTARRTNLAIMAEGAGIPSVMTVESPDQLAAAARFLTDAPAPRFLWARVKEGPPSRWARNFNLSDCRLRFRNAWLAKHPAQAAR
jgi:thiamine pyrophosphate-dependent acetolactate synthase large subunit-like protein